MEGPPGYYLTSIKDLPEDCLNFIFQRLECNSDRESFGLTCHRWLHIQNINRLFLQFQCSFTQLDLSSLSQTSPTISSFHLNRLLTRFQQLESLSLSGCTELPDSGLTPLQYYGSRLQKIFLDCCFRITDDGLSLIAIGCPSLTLISLYRCNITDVGLQNLAESCSGLKDVNLSYCVLISDHGLRALSQKCSQLRAVSISFCKGVSGVGFRGCCSPTLAYLEAESCKLEPEGITAIVNGGGLEYLNVSNLRWCIAGDGLAAIGGAGLGTKLRVLNLRMCRSVSSESVAAIAKGCPFLQDWNLSICHEVKIPGWKAVGENCNNLEIIHLNRCRNLCDRGLQALRDGCRRLRIMYITGYYQVSVPAMEMFKWSRSDVQIKEEEITTVPNWPFR